MSTKERLVQAAADLLDRGGESAVTLRAVGERSGVSHNAPYRHFKDRGALLAAVATRDFLFLTGSFEQLRLGQLGPLRTLEDTLGCFVHYSREAPARYRLLFSDPDIAAQGGELEAAALKCFQEFAAIVAACQAVRVLPPVPNPALTKLIYASVHGLIDLQAGGRMKQEKGLGSVEEGVSLLIALLARNPAHLEETGG